MRLIPKKFLVGRLRPSYTSLKPTVYIPSAFLWIRGKTFDIVQILGRARITPLVSSYLGITDEADVRAYGYRSTEKSETISVYDIAPLMKVYTISAKQFPESLLSTRDDKSISFVDVLTFELSDNVSTVDRLTGSDGFGNNVQAIASETIGHDLLIGEPYPDLEPPLRPNPNRFVSLETKQLPEKICYRLIQNTEGGKIAKAYDVIPITEKVFIQYTPFRDLVLKQNGLVLAIYSIGPWDVGTADFYDYTNLDANSPDVAKSLAKDKAELYVYTPVVKEVEEQIKTSGYITPYPEFEVYIPGVLRYSYFEETPTNDIFYFQRVIPDYENNLLNIRIDFVESAQIEEDVSFGYYVPPIYTIRFKDAVDVKDALEGITYYYKLDKREAVDVTEEWEVQVKVTRISKAEFVPINEDTNVVKIVFNSFTVSRISTDRTSVYPPTITLAEFEISKISTDRTIVYPAYIDKVKVEISKIGTDRAII